MRALKVGLLLLVITIVGCSSSDGPPTTSTADGGHSGDADDASGQGGVEAGASGTGVETDAGHAGGQGGGAVDGDGRAPIFTAESTAIRISSFDFFSGGYAFARRRDQLSSDQLALVERIQVIPSTDECWEDAIEMRVTVNAGDSESTYGSNEYNGDCGRDSTLVDFAAVRAVLGTVHCLSAKGYDGRTPEMAPTISADDGCRHGLFNGSGASPDWWFRVEIAAPGDYRVSFEHCGDRALLVELFESDAETPLASAAGEGECPSLTQHFDAGVYLLHARMQGGIQAGDFYLSVDQATD